MKRILKLVLLLTAFFMYDKSIAQDVGFSQFYQQPLLRNPALAGIFNGDVRLTASYRNQWESVTVPYRTFSLSSEIKLPPSNSDLTTTIGLGILRDVAGTSEFSTTQLLPAVNFSKKWGETFISLGFITGFTQQKFNPDKLILNDQFVANTDGSFTIVPYSGQTFNKTSINYFDLSGGITCKSSLNENVDYYAGIALFHLYNSKIKSFEDNWLQLNKKIALNVGLSNAIGDADELILYADYFDQYTSNFKRVGISTAQLGIMYNHVFFESDGDNSITGGLLYRWNDALIPVVELELSKFVIGMSYDINISKLTVASQARGGFELTLSYKSFLSSRNPDLTGSRCPTFGKRKVNPYYK